MVRIRVGKKKIIDEDEPFVCACQKGEIEAFETLVKKHQKQMFNIAFRLIGDFEEAGDVVQEAFIAAYKSIKKFKGRSKFTTWMTRIVINKSKNRIAQLRSKKSMATVSLDDCFQTKDLSKRHHPASSNPSPLESLEKKMLRQQVQWCIGTITEGFREVLVLRDIQGFSISEIGDIIGIPEGTVKSKLFRARDSLKACLEKVLGDLAHVVS